MKLYVENQSVEAELKMHNEPCLSAVIQDRSCAVHDLVSSVYRIGERASLHFDNGSTRKCRIIDKIIDLDHCTIELVVKFLE